MMAPPDAEARREDNEEDKGNDHRYDEHDPRRNRGAPSIECHCRRNKSDKSSRSALSV